MKRPTSQGWIVVVLSLLYLLACQILDDGSFHVIDTVIGDCVTLENDGTSLLITETGAIMPTGTNNPPVRAFPGTSVTVAGGVLQNDDSSTADGMTVEGCSILVTDGEVLGSGGGTTGQDGINATDASDVTISGGTVKGGDGNTGGGGGVYAATTDFVLTGGLVRGGDGGTSGGDALRMFGGGHLSISGGQLVGGEGGTTGGDAAYLSDVQGTITAGDFVAEGHGASAAVFLGASDVEISGGRFHSRSASALNAGGSTHLTLRGGKVDGRIVVAGTSVLDVFGNHLEIQNGRITGTLADGSSLDCAIVVYPPAEVHLNLPPVSVRPMTWGAIRAAYR